MNLTSAAVDGCPSVASRNTAVAMIDEGNALEEQGRIAEAMARYDAALQANPQCARAHLNRGNIFLAGAQLDEARSAYNLAIACDPRYAAAHFNLGNLNYGAGDFELALCNYEAAVGLKPDFADAFVAMANALDSMGRTAKHEYRIRFTDDPSGANLLNWARFEADNPDTFAGMYQFWIQKPISH